MALVTTPGAADANSYADVAYADAYHAARPQPLAAWATTTTAKEGALTMAARVLDAMPRAWTGAPVDEVQALSWPRSGMATRNGFAIPTSGATSIQPDLKNAQSELAGQLLEAERLGDNDALLQGITDVTAGPVSVSFAERPAARLALQRRESLEAMIPDAVILLLVPSWLKDVRDEDALYTGLVFESLEE